MTDTKDTKTNTIELLGIKIDPEKLSSPALRNMVEEMQHPDYGTRLYDSIQTGERKDNSRYGITY